jgi:hypothetical protein
MFRVLLSASIMSGVALGLTATGASAGISGPVLDALKADVPSAVEKVHEGKGGVHENTCYRHPKPGQYLECHTHFKNEDGNWIIRRSLPGGPPTVYCPEDCDWNPPKDR